MIGLWPSIVMNGWPGDLIADCGLQIADCGLFIFHPLGVKRFGREEMSAELLTQWKIAGPSPATTKSDTKRKNVDLRNRRGGGGCSKFPCADGIRTCRQGLRGNEPCAIRNPQSAIRNQVTRPAIHPDAWPQTNRRSNGDRRGRPGRFPRVGRD